MRFQGFYGNTNAVAQLSGMLDTGRFPHAVLIDGPEGSGRRTLSRILAQAMVCESDGEKPCGQCRQCHNAQSGNHPDIILCAPSGGARSFSVDAVRRVRMDAYIAPNDASRKVYILTEAQNMTESAQNALLKIIEEPPAHAMFILTCAGRSQVLTTVQSRCALITLGPVSEEECVQALREKMPELADADARTAARIAGCVIGRAEQGLRENSFSAAVKFAGEFSGALCGSDPYRFLAVSAALEKDGELLTAFMGLLPLLLRDATARKAGESGSLSGCAQEAERLAVGLTRRQLYALMQVSLQAAVRFQKHVNKTLLLTHLFSQLWACAHDTSAV